MVSIWFLGYCTLSQLVFCVIHISYNIIYYTYNLYVYQLHIMCNSGFCTVTTPPIVLCQAAASMSVSDLPGRNYFSWQLCVFLSPLRHLTMSHIASKNILSGKWRGMFEMCSLLLHGIQLIPNIVIKSSPQCLSPKSHGLSFYKTRSAAGNTSGWLKKRHQRCM